MPDNFTTTKSWWAAPNLRLGRMRAAGWTSLTQYLHEQRQNSDINNICKSLGMSTRKEFDFFSYTVVCIGSFYYIYVGWKQPTLIELSENTQSTELHFLKTKNVSFFEDTKNGPTIITLLLLNHRIDFRCD